MDSETIAQGCKRGDPAAQAALYRRFRPVLWRVVTRYVPDPARAEDLLHDAFLLAYTHIGQLRDDARLEAWLVRLTRNLALLHLRQTATIATLPLDETNALELPAESGEATGQPTLDELLELVGRLPEGYRNVFRLHVLDGLSHEEIAARLHISAHTSSSRLLRARDIINSVEGDESVPPALADISSQNSGPLLEKVRHRPAFSVTLGLRRALRGGWGVGGSMGYTRLTTDFVLGEGAYVLRTQRLHYLGLSLLADRTCYTTPSGRFSLSAAAGATVEIPLRGTETTAYVTDVTVGDSAALRLYPRLQWSLSGSVGLQYRFTPHLSLEFSPTFRFYPDNGSPLRSLYSDRPWQFTVPLSLRWSF